MGSNYKHLTVNSLMDILFLWFITQLMAWHNCWTWLWLINVRWANDVHVLSFAIYFQSRRAHSQRVTLLIQLNKEILETIQVWHIGVSIENHVQNIPNAVYSLSILVMKCKYDKFGWWHINVDIDEHSFSPWIEKFNTIFFLINFLFLSILNFKLFEFYLLTILWFIARK